MHAFLRIFVALVTAAQCVWAEFVLRAEVPALIRNEEPTKVALALTGDLAGGVVTEVRTVLQTPGKRRPKPYANFTHEAPLAAEDAHAALLNLSPVYSVPTKTYLLSYSVRVDFANELELEPVWVDSEATEVKVVDPDVSFLKFAFAALVLIASTLALLYTSFYMASSGWWESVLPAQLHWLLPKPGKKRA